MICKKCGNNIDDNSKFCGVCGDKIEEVLTPINNETVLEQNIQSESVVEEIPMVVPLIQPEPTSVVEEPFIPEVNIETNQTVESINENAIPVVDKPLEQTPVVEPISPESNVQPIINENITPVVPTPEVKPVNGSVTPVSNKETKKKNSAWVFVLLGVLLGVVALMLLVFAFNKGANTDVKVLEKALNNLIFKGERSGTIDAKLLIQSDTEDAMNLSATIKYAKQGDDNYNFNLTLNKSMFFDEINLYASILDERATLYANSSLIDMLGLTSSTPSMWVHMTTTEQELEMQTGTETDELDDLNLSTILDKNHFKLIGTENNLNHYQLVIDNDLVNKIKVEVSKEEDLKSFADSLSELTETYYVDFFINNSNELVKISMDLTNSLSDESIKSAIISFEFTNLDSTSVQIPIEAKNSTIDLETYMSTYAIKDDSTIDPTLDQNYTYQY